MLRLTLFLFFTLSTLTGCGMAVYQPARDAGFELDPAKAKAAEAKATKEGLGSAFKAYTDLKDFVNALTTPRRIVLLVPAGKPVDSALAALGPLLDKGDCVVDGGNEWYENTERRAAQPPACSRR